MSIKILDIFEHSQYENIIYTYFVCLDLPIGLAPVIVTNTEYHMLKIADKKEIKTPLNVVGNSYNLTLHLPNSIFSINDKGKNKELVFEALLKKEKEIFYVEYSYNNLKLKIVLNFPDELLTKVVTGFSYKFSLSNYTLTLEPLL
jgi:hypothetical protein